MIKKPRNSKFNKTRVNREADMAVQKALLAQWRKQAKEKARRIRAGMTEWEFIPDNIVFKSSQELLSHAMYHAHIANALMVHLHRR